MRLVVANIEQIEASRFLVANVYGNSGHLVDQVIFPFESYEKAFEHIRELGNAHNMTAFELYTRDADLFKLSLTTAGVGASIKHPSDVSDTKAAINQHEDILREIYDITPLIPKPKPPKWRTFLVSIFTKITNKIRGDYDYEI